MIKQRNESVEIYKKNKREDLLKIEQGEIDLLSTYLPKQLSDEETKKIVLIGEIGGNLEEKAAEYIKNNIKKEVVAYIAGISAPKEKRMGHAGAIIEGNSGTAESKIKALEKVNVRIAKLPGEVVSIIKNI